MAIDPHSDAALEVSDQADYLQKLKQAPIEDFARYIGVGLDEAVNLRVAEAVKAAPLAMDATVRLIEPKNNLLGFANVTFNGAVTVTDFKVLTGKEGELYVAAPSKPSPGSRTGYSNTVRLTDEAKEQLSGVVLAAYDRAVEKLQDRAAAIAADRPPRIADQVKKAGEKAAEHNTGRPAPDKGKVKNAER